MADELQALIRRIERMGRSEAKVAMLEEAVRIADSRNDVQAGFDLRHELVEEAQFTGHPEKALVAFTWTLAQADRDPESFEEVDLLWQYKWVVGNLDEFPQITREQMKAAVEDLARRSQRNGAGLRHVYSLRCQLARGVGNKDEVLAALPLWKKSPRDFLSDCPACDRDSLVATHLFLGQDRRALQLAAPIMNGVMRCTEVPHVTFAQLLVPLLKLGRIEEAHAYHNKGYALVRNNPEFVSQQADHMVFMVLTRDLKGAVQLFERHLALGMASAVPVNRYDFYRASSFFLRHLAATGFKRMLRLPEPFPLHQPDGHYDLAALAAWFEREARSLAEQFDARNGNTYRSEELAAMSELDALIQPEPEGE